MAKKTKTTAPVPSQKGSVHKRSPWYPLLCCIMMWGGFIVGMFSWIQNMTIFGFSTQLLGLPAGIIALAGVFMMLGTVKCPACGGRKLGRAMGAKVPKECECPECHATVQVEWPKKK